MGNEELMNVLTEAIKQVRQTAAGYNLDDEEIAIAAAKAVQGTFHLTLKEKTND